MIHRASRIAPAAIPGFLRPERRFPGLVVGHHLPVDALVGTGTAAACCASTAPKVRAERLVGRRAGVVEADVVVGDLEAVAGLEGDRVLGGRVVRVVDLGVAGRRGDGRGEDARPSAVHPAGSAKSSDALPSARSGAPGVAVARSSAPAVRNRALVASRGDERAFDVVDAPSVAASRTKTRATVCLFATSWTSRCGVWTTWTNSMCSTWRSTFLHPASAVDWQPADGDGSSDGVGLGATVGTLPATCASNVPVAVAGQQSDIPTRPVHENVPLMSPPARAGDRRRAGAVR